MNNETIYNGKCDDETCKMEFKENHIIYKCSECNKWYCFHCFCKKHYKKHKTKWLEFEIKNGRPMEPRKPSGPLKI